MTPDLQYCCDSCGLEKVMNMWHAAENSLQANGWVAQRKKRTWLYFCSKCWFDLMCLWTRMDHFPEKVDFKQCLIREIGQQDF